MKKLYLLMLMAVSFPAIIICGERTKAQKDAYLQNKQQQPGFRQETPEFRFALKLAEYLQAYTNGTITLKEFNTKMMLKIQNYLDHDVNMIIGKDFLAEYLALPLSELQARVGTIEKLGTMKRFVDQN